MRRVLFTAVLLVIGCGKGQRDAAEPAAEPVPPALKAPADEMLHTEKGLREQLTIEVRTIQQHIIDRQTDKALARAGQYTYHRFLIGETLHGSQARKLDNHILDDFQCLTAANPWDNIACVGALHTFDIRQEPLTYHHRTGPAGAVYRELRTRKGGKDANAPIAVLGLTAGTQACYALNGQKMTFYEADPVVVKLVADTDKYFSYVADARKRGAEIEIRTGNRRAKLKEDKNRKYAALFVDLAESFPNCTDIYTKDAVQEYLDRLTDDGIVAIHISNKYFRFEPMFAKIADELNLTARVWYDNVPGRHGKTESTWVVLARREQALGTLAIPEEQQKEYGSDFRPLKLDPDVPAWTDKNTTVVEAMRFKR